MKIRRFLILISLAAAASAAPKTADAMTFATDTVATSQKKRSNDSTATDLQEVVVEGRTQRVVKFGVEYIPGKKQKKMAMDANDLLHRMMIPTLRVNSGGGSVTTVGNESVSMFIDYVPASANDLNGLRPEDVLRVDVLEFPDDPRFNGAQHVINFIMQKYEWGGYTKLYGNGNFISSLSGSGTLYSKFVRKKWTFDAYASGRGGSNSGNKSTGIDTYRDIMFKGIHYDYLQRTTRDDDLDKRNYNREGAELRAAYNTDSLYFEHKVSFSRSKNDSHTRNSVDYTDNILPSFLSESQSWGQSITPSISGYYQIILPKKNTIVANWSFSYGHNKSNSRYIPGQDAPIFTDDAEDVYSPDVNISYTKGFKYNNSFRVSLMTYNTVYNTGYEGSSYNGRQKLLSSENMIFLEYMQNWKCGLNLYSRLGGSYVIGRINGTTTLKQFNPRLGLQLQYQINDKHRVSVSGWWGNSHPQASTANTALVQNNELMWVQGNPDLKNTIFQTVNADYTLVPNNWFVLYARLEYEGNPDKQSDEYYTLPGHDGLVHRTINSGNAHQYSAMVSISFRLLNNSLNFGLYGSANRTVLTGVDALKKNWLSAAASVDYYYRNFSFMIYYNTPSYSLNAWSMGRYSKYASNYGLQISYAVGNFKAGLTFSNLFDKYLKTETFFNSPLYSTENYAWNKGRGLSLSLSYTFSYGKKIDMSNELRGGGNVGSGILK